MASGAAGVMPTDPPVRYFAELAAQVYDDAPDFGAVKSAARAKLYAGGRILVFRGTDDWAAWVRDFQSFPSRTGDLGELHSGIYDAWEEIAEPILALSAPPQIIVGHSEGAGLAEIACGAFNKSGRAISQLFAFEPPRIAGDAVLRGLIESFGTMSLATQHGPDPVTRVPPWLGHAVDLSDIGRANEGTHEPIWYHLMGNIIPVFPA